MKTVSTICGIVLLLRVGTAGADVGDDYDAAVHARKGGVAITFGHDVDLPGKAWDFAKTVVDKVKLPTESSNQVKAALLNATDSWEDTAGHGLTPEDFERFVAKTMLDHLSARDMVRIKQTFNLSRAAARQAREHGSGVLEGAAQAAGEAAEGDTQALATALLATVDTVCAECAVARKGALLAVEAGRAVEAWVQDETTRMQYDTWKAGGPLLTTQGFGPTMVAARRALAAIHESQGRRPPTTQEVEQFVERRFQGWKVAEERQHERAGALDEVKEDYLALTDAERASFGGSTGQDRASAFADVFLPIYDQLLAARGAGPYPPGGRRRLLQDAVTLARIRAADGDGAYRERMFALLGQYGYRAAVPPERKEAIRSRLVGRLFRLSFANLKAFFDYAQLNQTEAFYGCLCASLPGVGLVKRYEPSGGLPCHLSGLGSWYEPFPRDERAWQGCLAQTPVGGESFADHVIGRIISWQGVQ